MTNRKRCSLRVWKAKLMLHLNQFYSETLKTYQQNDFSLFYFPNALLLLLFFTFSFQRHLECLCRSFGKAPVFDAEGMKVSFIIYYTWFLIICLNANTKTGFYFLAPWLTIVPFINCTSTAAHNWADMRPGEDLFSRN